MKICGKTPGEVIQAVENSMAKIRPLLQAEGIEKEAVIFTLRDSLSETGEIMLLARVGMVRPEKYETYFFHSQEKGHRLFHRLPIGHRSSWQSRYEAADQWGGAVASHSLISSASGLPELADEAVVLDANVNLGWMTREEADAIASISDNHYYQRLRELDEQVSEEKFSECPKCGWRTDSVHKRCARCGHLMKKMSLVQRT